jgi:hypothetical protein
MKKALLFLTFWLIQTALYAQNGTEVYLLDLSERGGQLTLKNPRNISNKPGYDNQPFFHPTLPILYYTAMMDDKQTDIRMYDYRENIRKPITQTPDSEYSPTVVPGERFLSCIVQRKDNGDQDLVFYELEEPELGAVMVESQQAGKVGYQAWMNAAEVALFVLGEPNTLHYRNVRTTRDTVVARNIGRSLHRIPGQNAISFVEQVGEKWLIRAYDPVKKQVRDLTESDPKSDHFNAWTANGLLLESRGNELWSFNPKTSQWQAVRLPDGLPRRKLSRIAVLGKRVALVVDEE